MTNATKANLIAALNAGLGFVIAFGVNLTDIQTAATLVFANAVASLFVGVTFKNSPKRVPEGTGVVEVVNGEVASGTSL